MYKTGGGVDPHINITQTDEKIKEMIGVSLEGLKNKYDSDAIIVEVVDDKENYIEYETEKQNWSGWSPTMLKSPKSLPLRQDEYGRQREILSDKVSPLDKTIVDNEEMHKADMVEREMPELNKKEVCTPKKTPTVNKRSEYAYNKDLTSILLFILHIFSDVRSTLKKNQLTQDCRVKVNIVSEARLELIELQKQALVEEIKQKKEEHRQKIEQNQQEHTLRIENLTLLNALIRKQLLN